MSEKKLVAFVNERLCKGCGICVIFCPKKIIELSDDKACVNNLNECIGCRQCEYHCPDFAITVGEIDG